MGDSVECSIDRKLGLKKPRAWDGLENAEYLTYCQARINKLLNLRTGDPKAKKFDDLLRGVRNTVFHYEAAYVSEEFKRLVKATEVERRWPERLRESFDLFFTGWIQSQEARRKAQLARREKQSWLRS